jgi:hypothetical protein
MQTPSTVPIWLSEQAVPLLTIVALLGVVLAVLYLSARRRRSTMNKVRAGATEETFVQSLLVYGFDANLARTTYQYLQQKQGVNFPIEAPDKLDEDLGLSLGDLDQSIRELLRLTHRTYLPGLKHRPLVTVEDLVRLIQASPRSAELAA